MNLPYEIALILITCVLSYAIIIAFILNLIIQTNTINDLKQKLLIDNTEYLQHQCIF